MVSSVKAKSHALFNISESRGSATSLTLSFLKMWQAVSSALLRGEARTTVTGWLTRVALAWPSPSSLIPQSMRSRANLTSRDSLPWGASLIPVARSILQLNSEFACLTSTTSIFECLYYLDPNAVTPADQEQALPTAGITDLMLNYQSAYNDLLSRDLKCKEQFSQLIISQNCEFKGCSSKAADFAASKVYFCQRHSKHQDQSGVTNILYLDIKPCDVLQALSSRKAKLELTRRLETCMDQLQSLFDEVRKVQREKLGILYNEASQDVLDVADSLLQARKQYCSDGSKESLARILRLKEEIQKRQSKTWDWNRAVSHRQEDILQSVSKIKEMVKGLNDLKLPVITRRVLKDVPEGEARRAKEFTKQGVLLLGQNKVREAVKQFQMAVQANPRQVDAYLNLGYALSSIKKYNQAVNYLKCAIDIDPNNAIALGNLGFALNELKCYEEAEDSLMRAVKLDPNDVLSINNLANAQYCLKKYSSAIANYKLAIQLNKSDPDPYKNLAKLLREQGRNQDAQFVLGCIPK